MACLHKTATRVILSTLAFWLIGTFGPTNGAFTTGAHAQAQGSPRNPAHHSTNDPRLVARGKYIVEDVAVCTQCRTPAAETSIARGGSRVLPCGYNLRVLIQTGQSGPHDSRVRLQAAMQI